MPIALRSGFLVPTFGQTYFRFFGIPTLPSRCRRLRFDVTFCVPPGTGLPTLAAHSHRSMATCIGLSAFKYNSGRHGKFRTERQANTSSLWWSRTTPLSGFISSPRLSNLFSGTMHPVNSPFCADWWTGFPASFLACKLLSQNLSIMLLVDIPRLCQRHRYHDHSTGAPSQI